MNKEDILNILKKVRIALKREPVQYFENIKETFIPLKGEVVFVDFPEANETRAKVGDGVTAFADLPYIDQHLRDMVSGNIIWGYYFENKFYLDEEHKITVMGYPYKMYIDIPTREVYGFYNADSTFVPISSVPKATEEVAGVAKLYNGLGNNTDGSINQKSVTDELNRKFVISLDHDEGLIFEDGIEGNEV